jgi:hypothetical protein
LNRQQNHPCLDNIVCSINYRVANQSSLTGALVSLSRYVQKKRAVTGFKPFTFLQMIGNSSFGKISQENNGERDINDRPLEVFIPYQQISRLARKRDRIIPNEYKQERHLSEQLSARNMLDCDLSDFEPLYFSSQLGLSKNEPVPTRRLEPHRKESNEMNSGLWSSMDQLNIANAVEDTIRSGSIATTDNAAPPQFSSKFLFEDEGNIL